MTPAQLNNWKNAKDQYMTSQGGIVTVLDLRNRRLTQVHSRSRWHDGAKQITLGLFAQGTLYKSLPNRLAAITGHAPGDNAVRDWVRQFQQRHTRRSNALL